MSALSDLNPVFSSPKSLAMIVMGFAQSLLYGGRESTRRAAKPKRLRLFGLYIIFFTEIEGAPVKRCYDNILELIGDTPLVKLNRLNPNPG